jgi:prolyl oligopeptidase
MQEGLEGPPRVLIDPNTLSEDGTIALADTAFSRDGAYVAYSLSARGSDWKTVHIRDIETGEDLPEVLHGCKWANVAWSPEGGGFYYTRLPDSTTVPPEDRNHYSRIYWHELGRAQSEDRLIYEQPDDKELWFSSEVTDDGRFLVMQVGRGTSRKYGVYYRRLGPARDWVRLLPVDEARYGFIDNLGDRFLVWTDLDAPRGRIIAVDTRRPQRSRWEEIIPERGDAIASAAVVGDRLVVEYLHDAYSVIRIHGLDGTFESQVELPTLGTIEDISGRRAHREMFFSFESFTFPETIYRYDFDRAELEIFRAPEIDFDGTQYETRQVMCTSADGTRVPLFITHKKGLERNGANPTLLYGYGGFTSNMTPFFSTSRTIWMAEGGVFAVAVLRGGNEYGEEWHRAGMLENRQNVFDDFIACAEWLIDSGYTATPRLAIQGASNGGLLVAACMLQRPELFGAAIAQVPVIDMLRYHKFTVGHFWTGEYGNAEANPDHFEFMYAYSPLHNVQEGAVYPPTLVTTADTDDRVVPAHGKKFAATLQAHDAGVNPILLRVETKAGHGAGKPISKIIEEQSDIYAFLHRVMDLE